MTRPEDTAGNSFFESRGESARLAYEDKTPPICRRMVSE